MSFNLPPDPDDPPVSSVPLPPRRTRSRALVLTLVVLALLVIVFWIFTGLYTDLLWYRSVGTGFALVFQTQLKIRLLMFVVFGGLMAAAVAVNCWLAYRARPAFRGISAEQQGLDRYRVAIDPYRRVLVILAAGVLGLITGGSAASEWRTALQFFNSQPFYTKDTQFGLDLSFYAFRLPFWRFLVGFGFGIVLVSLVAAVLVHYLYGGLRLQTPGDKTTPWARAHIAVLLGLFVLMKATAYWFDRYELVVKDGPRISGGTYTDINAVLPAKLILFCIAIICALLFFATVLTRNWLAPALGFGLLVLSAVVVGGIYPFFVQSFQVKPSEPDKEAPYIQRNIDATLKAYQLDTIQSDDYSGVSDPQQVTGALPTVRNVRLIDPAVVSPTVNNLQQLRGFYSFADTLDVDRYDLVGADNASTQREAVVAVRELNLNGIPASSHNFANDHTVYTHGQGFVAAYGNVTDEFGNPSFFEYNIPPQGLLKLTPDGSRVYFGENSPDYSIVGAPEGKAPVEFDYNGPSGQVDNTYAGNGGVAMGSLFGRVLFATKFGETNILLSDRINSASRILWNRDPRDRVEAVAPWLTVDGDAYPAVVDGKIVWIIDGYTTTNGYPYSQRTQLGDVTADSISVTSSAIASQPQDQVDYIRNSVKAVVDAYDGSVTLYEWDQSDPVLKVWEQAFPGTVQPFDSIPTQLMQHLRYPQDMFKVQRDLYAKYHVTDPKAFYSGQDFWVVPDDPTKETGQAQPPYYLTLQMPGQSEPSFSLTTTFVPNNRPNLAAFMAADADPGPDYGTVRVLELPKSTTVFGPGQVQNQFENDPAISSQLTLLRNGGSTVVFGNLLSLPVAGSLIYVEPVYIRASTGTTYPRLGKVLVSFNQKTALGNTLADALSQVLGTSTTNPNPPTNPPVTGGTSTALQRALADADQALQDANAALQAGPDWVKYGDAQKRLAAALELAVKLSQSTATTSPSPGATSSPSTSSSPSPSG